MIDKLTEIFCFLFGGHVYVDLDTQRIYVGDNLHPHIIVYTRQCVLCDHIKEYER